MSARPWPTPYWPDGVAHEMDGGHPPRAGPTIAVVTDRRGRARVSIDPTDIVVSTHPLESSALNSLPGKVTSVRRAGASVLLTADVGFPLVARVTVESCAKLGLTVGAGVVLTFKASAVVVC